VTDGGDGSVKVYDADNYKLLDRIAMVKDADSIGYDKRLYAIGGGSVDVYDTDQHGHVCLTGNVSTGSKARTARFVPQLN
jgi:hypothetical protein